MDNPFKSPVILSFCTGGRMLERGLERAIGNFTTAAYVEIEAFCVFNLVAQMEQGVVDTAPIFTDCKTFPSAGFCNKIHGIIGGYPCQPFSIAGKRQGADDPRHLWPYLRGHIKAIKPVWCFLENVDDHLSMGFDVVYRELRDLGYSVEAGLYSAEEVGATHERQRLFILAVDNAYLCRWRQMPAGVLQQSRWPLHQQKKRRVDSKIIRPGDAIQWPAPPGRPQNLWEERRTVKPGLGVTIDGYNFKDDLLRMLGNGVVEQTAELAFIDLLNKHGLSL